MATKTTRIDSLSVEQLHHLGRQLEAELQRLSQTANAIGSVATQFVQTGTAVDELKAAQEDQQLLVPLTESLYVAGHVHKKNSLLVDVGTGYYAEKNCDEAADFCSRKVEYLKDQLDSFGEEMRNKQNGLQQVEALIKQKVLAQQQAAAEQQALVGSKVGSK